MKSFRFTTIYSNTD